MNEDERTRLREIPEVSEMMTAMRPAMAQAAEVMRTFARSVQPLIDLYNANPELFAQLDEASPRFGGCHCMCAYVHGGTMPATCLGEREEGLAHLYGSVSVPMCWPCHAAVTELRSKAHP